MPNRRLACLTASILLSASAATAADQAPKELKLQSYGDVKNAKLYEYNTAVPAAPALGMVENTPELSFSAPFGPDLSKEVLLTGEKPGFALALRPYWVSGAGYHLSPDSYQHDTGWVTRTAARTVLSAAGAPVVTDEAKGLGAAVGLSTELLDIADPRFNDAHLACLGDSAAEISNLRNAQIVAFGADPANVAQAKVIALAALGTTPPPPALQAATTVDQVQAAAPMAARVAIMQWLSPKIDALAATQTAETQYKGKVARCFKRAKLAAESAPSFQVAGGVGWASETYSLSGMKNTGGKFWAAFRLPLGVYQDCRGFGKSTETMALDPDEVDKFTGGKCLPPRGNITAFAQHVTDDKITVAGAAKSAETSQYGLVLSKKDASNNWSVSASAVWNERNYKDAGLPTDKFERYAIAYAQNLGSVVPGVGAIWFEATFGQTSGIATAKDESYGLVRFVVK